MTSFFIVHPLHGNSDGGDAGTEIARKLGVFKLSAWIHKSQPILTNQVALEFLKGLREKFLKVIYCCRSLTNSIILRA